MQTADVIERYIVARDRNVVRVNFHHREPDPPGPTFPGAGALRQCRGADEDAQTACAAYPADASGLSLWNMAAATAPWRS